MLVVLLKHYGTICWELYIYYMHVVRLSEHCRNVCVTSTVGALLGQSHLGFISMYKPTSALKGMIDMNEDISAMFRDQHFYTSIIVYCCDFVNCQHLWVKLNYDRWFIHQCTLKLSQMCLGLYCERSGYIKAILQYFIIPQIIMWW